MVKVATTWKIGLIVPTPFWVSLIVSCTVTAVLPLKAVNTQAIANCDYSPGQAIAAALDANQIEGRNPLDKAQYVWIKTQFESQVLGWAGDRVDMANSLFSSSRISGSSLG